MPVDAEPPPHGEFGVAENAAVDLPSRRRRPSRIVHDTDPDDPVADRRRETKLAPPGLHRSGIVEKRLRIKHGPPVFSVRPGFDPDELLEIPLGSADADRRDRFAARVVEKDPGGRIGRIVTPRRQLRRQQRSFRGECFSRGAADGKRNLTAVRGKQQQPAAVVIHPAVKLAVQPEHARRSAPLPSGQRPDIRLRGKFIPPGRTEQAAGHEKHRQERTGQHSMNSEL